MNEPAVLLISTDVAWIKMADRVIRGVESLRVAIVASLDQAYSYGGWDEVALVLIHHGRGAPSTGVVRLLRMLAASRRPIATIILGEEIGEETELDLLRRGAADCLLPPYDLDRLLYLIETLTLRARQSAPGQSLSEEESPAAVWDELDPAVAQARRVAGQDATVLIRGESGAGKSRLARIIHELSPRKGGPLVTLRCGALTPEGVDEELFGVPGQGPAPVPGKLEAAREGTLVLDDVDVLTPTAQIALIRWIEEGRRESSTRGRARPDRPRIIATTRVALGDQVAIGAFRPDLFFRLNVIGLELPPLRQRRGEIVSIALGVLAELSGRSVTIAAEAIGALEGYSWPGNILEMREVLEAAMGAGGSEVVGMEHLPEVIRAAAGRFSSRKDAVGGAADVTSTLAETKREAEFHRITQALQRNGNNRLRTAGELGISRMTLYKKLYKYGIIEPSGAGYRGSPARSRGQSPPPGLEDAADTSPRAPVVDPSGSEGGSSARSAGHAGRPRQEKTAPALH